MEKRKGNAVNANALSSVQSHTSQKPTFHFVKETLNDKYMVSTQHNCQLSLLWFLKGGTRLITYMHEGFLLVHEISLCYSWSVKRSLFQ
jgi:hypothetical protein